MLKTKILPKTRVVIREDFAVGLAKGKKVLHIGMGGFVDNDSVTENFIQNDLATQSLHGKVSGVAASLTGIDINPKTIEAMKVQVPGKYLLGDITDPELPAGIDERYDLILFMDVIEHLDCFRSALSNIRHLLKPGGEVVISTASAYCLDSILKMMFNYESCHEEHTSYFSYLTMKRLLEMNDFQINTFMYTLQPRTKYNSVFDWGGFHLMKLVSVFMPQYAPGFVVVATPTQYLHNNEKADPATTTLNV